MMKKSSKGDIVIDLTSILDVIFILLMILMCNNQILVEKLADKENEMDKSISENNAEKDEYNNKIGVLDDLYDTYDDAVSKEEGINQYVCTIYVSSTYNKDKPSMRNIYILNDSGEAMETLELKGEDVSEEKVIFKDKLQTLIDNAGEDTPVILFLNYDDEKILYRDEKMINGIFLELASQENVFIK